MRLSVASLNQFINTLEQHIRSLNVLNIPVRHWDAILVPLILNKLEIRLVREWESHLCLSSPKDVLSSYKELLSFLLKRADSHIPSTVSQQLKFEHKSKFRTQNFHIASELNCLLRKKSHHIYSCDQFKKQNTRDRFDTAKGLKLCLNCLKSEHFVNNCKSSKCKTCRKSHHTLLHYDKGRESPTIAQRNDIEDTTQTSTIANCTTQLALFSQTLLPTAEIKVFDNKRNNHTTRALLDSASQLNFITESLAKKLNLPTHNSNIVINGITRTPSRINKCTTVKISSINNRFNCLLPCLILPQITDDIPQTSFNKNGLNLPNHIRLADPSFNISNPVEILIGSTVFWKLIEQGTS